MLLIAMLSAGVALGQEVARSGASVELVVERSGGGYEVTVSPRFVTVFYLPEKAIRALASNQKDFGITILGDTVVVRPLRDEPGLTANLNIDMKSLRISVVLKVGAPSEAVAQVIFTRAREKAELDRKVEAALAPLRAALDEKERSLATLIRAAADEAVAQGMAQGFAVQELEAVTRDGQGVILRVPRTVRIGDSVYVQIAVQNRSGRPLIVREAAVFQDGRHVAGRAVLVPREGKIEDGARARGVVVIAASGLAAGKTFELRLAGEPSGKTLALGGLRAP